MVKIDAVTSSQFGEVTLSYFCCKINTVKTLHYLMQMSHTIKESMKPLNFHFWLSLQCTGLPEMGKIQKMKNFNSWDANIMHKLSVSAGNPDQNNVLGDRKNSFRIWGSCLKYDYSMRNVTGFPWVVHNNTDALYCVLDCILYFVGFLFVCF